VRLTLFAIVAMAGAIGLAASQRDTTARPLPELDIAIDRSTRLLVIAPHPDDEALGAAGLIQRVRARGGQVRVVLLTSGDGFPEGVEVAEGVAHPKASDFRGYGVLREHETRAAMALLGLAPDQVTFLGFPDEGLCQIASKYLFDKRRAFESPYTGRESPPPTEQVVRGVKYRGVDLRRELERVIESFGPTLIALPHPEDEHPDHCSAHIFAREALAVASIAVQRRARVLHYLVHFGQWPLTPDGGIGTTLNPPSGFPEAEGRWFSMTLTADEAATKRRALLAYTTQMEVIGRFMLAFGRTNELFLEGEPASLPECWCDGENVATEAAPSTYRRRPARP
jgi:LmbE family N-acetylglucosaminyl deacetylase